MASREQNVAHLIAGSITCVWDVPNRFKESCYPILDRDPDCLKVILRDRKLAIRGERVGWVAAEYMYRFYKLTTDYISAGDFINCLTEASAYIAHYVAWRIVTKHYKRLLEDTPLPDIEWSTLVPGKISPSVGHLRDDLIQRVIELSLRSKQIQNIPTPVLVYSATFDVKPNQPKVFNSIAEAEAWLIEQYPPDEPEVYATEKEVWESSLPALMAQCTDDDEEVGITVDNGCVCDFNDEYEQDVEEYT